MATIVITSSAVFHMHHICIEKWWIKPNQVDVEEEDKKKNIPTEMKSFLKIKHFENEIVFVCVCVWPKRVYYIWCLWSSEVWLVYLKRSCIIVFVTFWNIMSSVFHGLVFTLLLSVLFYSLLLFCFFFTAWPIHQAPKLQKKEAKSWL